MYIRDRRDACFIIATTRGVFSLPYNIPPRGLPLSTRETLLPGTLMENLSALLGGSGKSAGLLSVPLFSGAYTRCAVITFNLPYIGDRSTDSITVH
jgi:hypothetical protein